jgi:hypothetical protein
MANENEKKWQRVKGTIAELKKINPARVNVNERRMLVIKCQQSMDIIEQLQMKKYFSSLALMEEVDEYFKIIIGFIDHKDAYKSKF